MQHSSRLGSFILDWLPGAGPRIDLLSIDGPGSSCRQGGESNLVYWTYGFWFNYRQRLAVDALGSGGGCNHYLRLACGGFETSRRSYYAPECLRIALPFVSSERTYVCVLAGFVTKRSTSTGTVKNVVLLLRLAVERRAR